MHMELEIGGRMLTAVFLVVFAYLVIRWWDFAASRRR